MQQPRDWAVKSQADACTYRMHYPMMSQADTAWAPLFRYRLGYTFTPGTLFISKVAGVKVYPRQTLNFTSYAVNACRNHVISPWHNKLMHALTTCITPWCHRLILHGLCCFDIVSDIPLLLLLCLYLFNFPARLEHNVQTGKFLKMHPRSSFIPCLWFQEKSNPVSLVHLQNRLYCLKFSRKGD